MINILFNIIILILLCIINFYLDFLYFTLLSLTNILIFNHFMNDIIGIIIYFPQIII